LLLQDRTWREVFENWHWQCSVGWHSITPCTALAIGDERGSTARLGVIKVQPHHAAPNANYTS